jgi:hypothetical protein
MLVPKERRSGWCEILLALSLLFFRASSVWTMIKGSKSDFAIFSQSSVSSTYTRREAVGQHLADSVHVSLLW